MDYGRNAFLEAWYCLSYSSKSLWIPLTDCGTKCLFCKLIQIAEASLSGNFLGVLLLLFSLLWFVLGLYFLKGKEAVHRSPRYLEMHVVLDKALVSLCILSIINCFLYEKTLQQFQNFTEHQGKHAWGLTVPVKWKLTPLGMDNNMLRQELH